MIGASIVASVLSMGATLGSVTPSERQESTSRSSPIECYQTSSGESCDIILRHAGPPERFTHTTEYECRDGFRFRLTHEGLNTGRPVERFSLTVTTLRPEHFAMVNSAEVERINNHFDGANVASISLTACGVYEGTAELLVTYFRIDWPQQRAVRFIVSADGRLDTGVEEPYN